MGDSGCAIIGSLELIGEFVMRHGPGIKSATYRSKARLRLKIAREGCVALSKEYLNPGIQSEEPRLERQLL